LSGHRILDRMLLHIQRRANQHHPLPLSVVAAVVLFLSTIGLAMGSVAQGTWSYFTGASEGMMTIHIAPPSSQNCTYSTSYWKTHPEAWPVEEIMLGGITYSKEEALIILHTPSRVLARQLIAAKLNVFHGADPTVIAETIVAADEWLTTYPLKREYGIELAQKLTQFNEGIIGPGACTESPSAQGRTRCAPAAEADTSFGPHPDGDSGDATNADANTDLCPGTPTPLPAKQPKPTASVPVPVFTQSPVPTPIPMRFTPMPVELTP